MLSTGDRLADFEVLALEGRGATAATYRARCLGDGRLVALKIPNPRLLTDPTFVVRFLQEASLGTRLRHRCIVRVFEAGEQDGVPYLVMELLEGLTLARTLEASGRVALRRALQIARDVASALEHAHVAGVVHRDLKPANIMLRVGRSLKVMDFGIARVTGEVGLTSSNLFIGSPAYAAPELARTSAVGPAADLYALGIILFEMITGGLPFTGNSAVEVVLQHQSAPFPARERLPVEVPCDVWRLVSTLVEKRPEDRLPDARSARVALELLLGRR